MSEDRREDFETRDRIDEIARNYDRFTRIVNGILTVMVAVIFGLGVLDTYLTIQGHSTADKAEKLGHDIQNQRKLAFLDECRRTNARHDDTVNKLHLLAEQLKRQHPDQVKDIDESVRENITLIEAFVPRQNCKKVLAKSVGIP